MADKMSYPLDLGLGDAPDPSLSSDVWQELNKISLAAKFLASALTGGITTPSTSAVGTIQGLDITIQNYAKVRRVATVDIPAGSVVEFFGSETRLSSSSYPYPTAFTEETVPAGAAGTFILLGLVTKKNWNLSVGSKYYMDPNIPGGITTAAGSRFVGIALNSEALFFDPVRM
jgi:hypothetical protein